MKDRIRFFLSSNLKNNSNEGQKERNFRLEVPSFYQLFEKYFAKPR